MMLLRDRQIGGIPLEKKGAFILTCVCSLFIVCMTYMVWSPLFDIPEEMELILACIGVALYLAQCSGRIDPGTERAQLFFGMYTGVSFPAGIYLLPRLPFPIITLLAEFVLSEDVSKYLGWSLQGDVSVKTIAVPFSATGLSSDEIRLTLNGKLFFEITNAAVVLSQDGVGDNGEDFKDSLRSEIASRIKRLVIPEYTAKTLYRGGEGGSSWLAKHVSQVCDLNVEFGVMLAKAPVVGVTIASERMQKIFDADLAKDLMRANTKEAAAAFKEFMENMPPGTSEEVAFAAFMKERYPDERDPLNVNIFKFK